MRCISPAQWANIRKMLRTESYHLRIISAAQPLQLPATENETVLFVLPTHAWALHKGVLVNKHDSPE